ncbi:MAG TPA: undecaprenyldiphospho-muramoylpentapeptide beta-N-acetylglucosaminyltransferase [Bacteroidales bacterium]|nr:MAG: UDP-N-acetylglucosamine--N-acetylmuramyl-(pentapeptide) pyrophosphoryl-undecaprenol N-acetylglucosamine transferase [Bacteroidetes bacterium ADurb.Bin139]HOG25411.1 undecaprenyldiphospho-muramoylpentapeptide beta-N-acetylglucosaminyltransferase [Bacteroidales bacterium]HOR12052.1 undecaprenyldiphospho-muramoylpentapeptide beta-N-acetylglucosaminyltransferase [Bacteroidales bacterium]HOZ19565.1 undecaprenyldiphospho-muramoylpentapeptide beta-N-acetylglucosaminyltransferase [Bacteroidales 
MKTGSKHRVIISGGGTGGHIFPAISIANAIRIKDPGVEILFVGALGRMEMDKVPAAGYRIIGLPIAGLRRDLSLRGIITNLGLPVRLARSVTAAGRIIRDFRPTVAVGVGGYASGPMLWVARKNKIPYILQEQNSFAGKTNKMLAAGARYICVAYPGMEQFFPASKVILTGNPIRKDIRPASEQEKKEALLHFGLDPGKRTLLITGGSLGAGTLNRCVREYLPRSGDHSVQILWQCGKNGLSLAEEALKEHPGVPVFVHEFIARMDLAYAAADVVVSRAGAGSISEFCAAGKACIFVPSPNVAEDHQTHNALALVKENAGWMVTDKDAPVSLMEKALELIFNDSQRQRLSANILKLSRPHAAEQIASLLLEL